LRSAAPLRFEVWGWEVGVWGLKVHPYRGISHTRKGFRGRSLGSERAPVQGYFAHKKVVLGLEFGV